MNTQQLPNVSNEKDILARIAKHSITSTGSTEPQEPTEEPVDLVVQPDEVEVEEVEELSETLEAEPETVELAAVESPETDIEELYIDLDGEEVSLSTVRDWKKGEMMHADYTRKSQVNADERRVNEATKEALSAKGLQLDDSIAQLSVFIGEFNKTDFDGYTLDELRENDPGEYLRVTEQQAKRKQALKDAKKRKADDSNADFTANAQRAIEKLATDNHWLKDGKQTAAYTRDTEIVKTYLTGLGYSEDMMQGALTTGNGQVFIDAAKYHAAKKSNAAITKKVRKAPVVTKPGGAIKSAVNAELQKAIDNHKRLGSVDSAFKLQKLRRKTQGN